MAITLSHPEPDDQDEHPDLHLTPEGNMSLADGNESIKQRVLQRLRFWRGESFLYTERGIPYIDELLQRPESVGLISVVLTEEVIDVDGVVEVNDVKASIDPAIRRMSWSASILTDTGEIIPIGVTV